MPMHHDASVGRNDPTSDYPVADAQFGYQECR
jgi:hypothetical protein